MAASFASRMAGKALTDFLKSAYGAVGSAAKKKTLSFLSGIDDASGLIGLAARHPETAANIVGAATPLALSGGIAGAGMLMKKMQQPSTVYAQSGYSLPVQKMGTPVSFANQQYVGGVSPMTNQAAAEAMLEQQKFQHQLQLIEARQAAATRQGSLQPVPQQELSSLSNLLSRTYTY